MAANQRLLSSREPSLLNQPGGQLLLVLAVDPAVRSSRLLVSWGGAVPCHDPAVLALKRIIGQQRFRVLIEQTRMIYDHFQRIFSI